EPWAPGAASEWWIHHALESLQRDLARRGSRLIIRRGPSLAALRDLIAETGAAAVYWNRLYDPALVKRDTGIKQALHDDGIRAKSFEAYSLPEPTLIQTRTGQPYKVFTPFWKEFSSKADI